MNNFFPKILKYLKEENRLLSVTLGVLLLFSLGSYALASFYPGETNDPNCAPGDSGCYVDVFPSQTGNSGKILTTNGTTTSWTAAGAGTVTSFSAGDLSPLFSTSESLETSTPALSFTLTDASSYTLFGNNTGSSASPSYFAPVLASSLFANQGSSTTVLHGNASGDPTWGSVVLSTDVSGVLPVLNGGTGLSAYGAGSTLLGTNAAGDGLEYKTVGGDLSLSGTTFTIVSNAVTTSKIADSNVTLDKIAAVSMSKLLGSSSSGTSVTEITIGPGLSLSGTTLSNSGVISLGAMDGVTKDATNGLVIDSGSLYAQSADISNPGLVSIAAQTFNGIKTFDDGLNAGGDLITGVLTPSSDTDAANKAYVDGLANGLKWKETVEVATTVAGGNITLSGEQTIDGVLTSADRVLVKNQTDPIENGIYVSAAGAWSRATDADTGDELVNAAVAVSLGTTNAGKAFTQTTPATITLGASSIVWVNFLSTSYGAGTGLSLSGTTFSVDFSTVTGSLGATHGGTGLTAYGSGNQLLGMNSGGTALEYKTLGGDATLSGSTLTIASNAVTYAKMQAVSTTSKLLGSSSTTTAVQEITLGSGLSLSGTTLSATSSTAALSSLTAATGTNSIDNDEKAQTWRWDGLTTETGLKIASTTQTTGTLLSVINDSTTGANAIATGAKLVNIEVSAPNDNAVNYTVLNVGVGTGTIDSSTIYAQKITHTKAGSGGANVGLGIFVSGGSTNDYLRIGSSESAYYSVKAGGQGINFAATGAIGNITFTSPVTTGTTTASGFVVNGDSLTSGTGQYISSSSLTSGILMNVQVTGTAASGNSQTAFNIGTSGANATTNQGTFGAKISNTHTGTAATNTALYLNASGTSGNTHNALVVNAGNVGIGGFTGSASGNSPTSLFHIVGEGYTSLSAEKIDINFDLDRTVQFAAGSTISLQRAVSVDPPTYTAASARTISNAATVEINGAPVAGSNATLSNSYGLFIADSTSASNIGVTGTYGLRVQVPSYGDSNRWATVLTAHTLGGEHNALRIQNTSFTTNQTSTIGFYDGTQTEATAAIKSVATSGTDGDLKFFVKSGSTAYEQLTLAGDAAGANAKFGIGDTSPSYRLDVYDNASASYVASFTNDGNAAARGGILVQAGLDNGASAGPSTLIGFNDGDGGTMGSITFGSSVVAYNVTSDQRLKENITDTALSLSFERY